MQRFLLSLFGIFSLMRFGMGCAPRSPESGTSGGRASLAGLAPDEVAARLQFAPGDSFALSQAFLGLGGEKTVTLRQFAPMYSAEFAWSATTTRETDDSKLAREQYENDLKRLAGHIKFAPPPPKVETAEVSISGTVTNLNLRNVHAALLPAQWEEKAQHGGETSGIWLSDDAFQELSRTKQTVLSLGVLDAATNTIVKNILELKNALAKLRNQATQESQHKDLTLLKAEDKTIEYPLTVNGEAIKVSAIRARNWFGEVVVLNSRNNPLILKVTLNPLAAASDMKNLFGFEVTRVTLVKP